MIFYLLRTKTRRIEVGLRVPFDFGSTALPCFYFVAKIAELVHQCRLVDRCGEVLGLEEAALLESAGRAVRPLRHIEDDGVGVELGRGVAVDRAGRVVLELGGDESAGRLGWVVPADPCLRVEERPPGRLGGVRECDLPLQDALW